MAYVQYSASECARKTAKQKIGEEKPKRQEVEFCGKSQGRFALCATYTESTTWSRNRTDGPCSPAKGTSFTVAEKSGPTGVTSRGTEKPRALIWITFGPFGPQNGCFLPKTTEREK